MVIINLIVQMIFFILAFQILNSMQFSTANVNCKTPDGKFGSCVILTECQFIKSFILETRNISIQKQFLRNYKCGFYGRCPKLCCPNEPIVNNLQSYNNYIELNSYYPTSNEIFHKNLKLLPRKCGLNEKRNMVLSDMSTALSNSVINVAEATLNEFPWMALLSYSTNQGSAFECVGTIINERYILTAANCIRQQLTSVRVGAYNILSSQDCKTDEYNITKCSLPTQDITIEKQIPHKKFRFSFTSDDIALLRLSNPLNIYSENVKAICLPLQSSSNTLIAPNIAFILTGWGVCKRNFKSEVLLKTEVSTITQEQCTKFYKNRSYNLNLTNKQFCFGDERNLQTDPCNSDTGSPVQKLNGKRYTQYGIVSVSSKECGRKGISTVNTRIDQYIDWILDNIEQ